MRFSDDDFEELTQWMQSWGYSDYLSDYVLKISKGAILWRAAIIRSRGKLILVPEEKVAVRYYCGSKERAIAKGKRLFKKVVYERACAFRATKEPDRTETFEIWDI